MAKVPKGKKAEMMESYPVGAMLWKLSLPTITGMVVQASYNMVDAAFIGKGVGTLALGGTTICLPFQMLMGAMGGAIGMGGASLVSRALGRHDRELASRALGNVVALALILGIAATLLGKASAEGMVTLFGASEEIKPYALEYLGIILLGCPLTLLAMSSNAVVRSEGNANVAMLSMVISGLTNVFLDWLFIFHFHMGVAGAAWGTLLSKLLVVIWLISHFTVSPHKVIKLSPRRLRVDRDIVSEISSIGISAFVRMAGTSLVMASVNNAMGIYGGPYYVAAYGVTNRVMSIVYMAVNGVALGMQPLAGYNYGAGLFDRVRSSIKLSIIWGTGGCVFFFLLLFFLPERVFSLFTNDPDLIAAGVASLPTIVAGTSLVAIHRIGATAFQALGKGKPAFWLSMTRHVLVFLPLLATLPRFMGLTGVLLSFPLADAIAAGITLLPLSKEMGQLKKEALSTS